MKTKNLQFDQNLQNQLLIGAIVIWYQKGEHVTSILIRLPKDRKGDYEYELHQTSLYGSSKEKTYHAFSYNDTKGRAIKKASKDHYEDEYHGMRQSEKSIKNATS